MAKRGPAGYISVCGVYRITLCWQLDCRENSHTHPPLQSAAHGLWQTTAQLYLVHFVRMQLQPPLQQGVVGGCGH